MKERTISQLLNVYYVSRKRILLKISFMLVINFVLRPSPFWDVTARITSQKNEGFNYTKTEA
jgi:hypothetical protein